MSRTRHSSREQNRFDRRYRAHVRNLRRSDWSLQDSRSSKKREDIALGYFAVESEGKSEGNNNSQF